MVKMMPISITYIHRRSVSSQNTYIISFHLNFYFRIDWGLQGNTNAITTKLISPVRTYHHGIRRFSSSFFLFRVRLYDAHDMTYTIGNHAWGIICTAVHVVSIITHSVYANRLNFVKTTWTISKKPTHTANVRLHKNRFLNFGRDFKEYLWKTDASQCGQNWKCLKLNESHVNGVWRMHYAMR